MAPNTRDGFDMLKRFIAALAVMVAAVAPQTAWASFEKKVALVIGNGAYVNTTQLENPVRDAKAMAASFERLGFEVVTGFDLTKQEMNSLLRQFSRQVNNADLTTFFYAGHAMQANGSNYLIPVDAELQQGDDTALDWETVKVDFVVDQIYRENTTSLVFLDACRDNPLARSWGTSTRSTAPGGLAEVKVNQGFGRGLAIAFATAPDMVAYDGSGQNSPFTEALLRHIETPGESIQNILATVTGEVRESTEGRQSPWINLSLDGPLVLKPRPVVLSAQEPQAPSTATQVAALPGPGATVAIPGALPSAPRATVPTDNVEAQIALYEFAERKGEASYYQVYLQKYPEGLFADNARTELERLRSKPAQEVAAVAPATTPESSTSTGAAVAAGAAGAAAAAAVTTPASDGFTLTDAMRKEVGTQDTETALAMDRNKRREVQRRLNFAEADVGGADGLFGPRTRRGITTWQEGQGFVGTGFLTAPQLKALEAQTETEWAAFQAQQRTASTRSNATQRRASTRRATTRRATTRRASTKRRATTKRSTRKRTVRRKRTTTRRTTRRRSNANNAAAAAFVGGVVGGIIGGAIR